MKQKDHLRKVSVIIAKFKIYILEIKDRFNIKNIDFKKINFDKSMFKNINLRKIKIKDIDIKDKGVRKIIAVFMVVVIVGTSYGGYRINEFKTRAFDIYIGKDKIGTMRSKEEALKIMDEIEKDLCDEYRLTVVLDNKLSFEESHSKDSNLSNENDIKENIKSSVGFLVSGYSIQANGETLGFVKSKKEAEYIIDTIKEPYLKRIAKDSKIKDVKLVEDIQMVKTRVKLEDISKQEELIKFIRTGADEIKIHVVEVGESFWTIAKIYDSTVEDLISANPDSDPTRLKPGDEVKLMVPTSKITVATIEEVQYNEKLNYDVKVEEDSSMYANQKKIKVKGEYGESKVVADEVKHNGMLVEKNIITEEIIKEPTTEVVIKGTKPVPKTAATGSFLMPTRGRLSSRYGMRWGTMHRGIDLAASTGTNISAADGGTVTFAGYKGTYGYLVEIDHGNGYKTRYAHCSRILVKKGAKVYKGQVIAKVGNTGRSTGPHLHFEVLKNGVHQNPSNFVR